MTQVWFSRIMDETFHAGATRRLPAPTACQRPPHPPAACRLPPAACRLPPAACRLPPAACRLPPASARPIRAKLTPKAASQHLEKSGILQGNVRPKLSSIGQRKAGV